MPRDGKDDSRPMMSRRVSRHHDGTLGFPPGSDTLLEIAPLFPYAVASPG